MGSLQDTNRWMFESPAMETGEVPPFNRNSSSIKQLLVVNFIHGVDEA